MMKDSHGQVKKARAMKRKKAISTARRPRVKTALTALFK
jgi:hypothetical protein